MEAVSRLHGATSQKTIISGCCLFQYAILAFIKQTENKYENITQSGTLTVKKFKNILETLLSDFQ
jgi:hypothetical protein